MVSPRDLQHFFRLSWRTKTTFSVHDLSRQYISTKLFHLFFLLCSQVLYAQTVAEPYTYGPEITRKMETLRGEWLLASKLTIGNDKNDTLSRQVYNVSKYSPAASRPKIILSFRTGGELLINDYSVGQKIVVIWARWRIDDHSYNDTGPFFLETRNTRYTSTAQKVPYEFKGMITDMDSNHFQLIDKSRLSETNQWIILNFVKL